jgi:hypothetical protein
MTEPVWFSSLQLILWVRIGVSVVGCVIGFLIWLDALVDYRLRKRLKLNGGLLILAVWQVITESGHLVLNLSALYLSYESWRIDGALLPAQMSLVFTGMVVVLVALSVNSFIKRRRFVALLQAQGVL